MPPTISFSFLRTLACLAMSWTFSFRIKAGYRYMYDEQRMIVRASPWTIIKGPCEDQELEAMLFVASHTTIPYPRVYYTHHNNKGLFIEMEYIRGITLEVAWKTVGGIPNPTKQRIGRNIQVYVTQLRELIPPTTFSIGSAITGGPVKDGCIGTDLVGPFQTLSEFQKLLNSTGRNWASPTSTQQDLKKDDRTHAHHPHHPRQYRICFTHADICPRNLILKADGTLVLIDWEIAGWWPEYWEYTKCFFGEMDDTKEGWFTIITTSLPVYTAELK